MNAVELLANAFEKFPGIGSRQAKRFVYHLLSASPSERANLSKLITKLGSDVHQCIDCYRFWSGAGDLCRYCNDASRDESILMIVEKDQDINSVEKANSYRGRYFVLGGILTLSDRGSIREQELIRTLKTRSANNLKEVVLALSATSEGEHTSDRVREILAPFRDKLRVTVLGRGLSTGNELEYTDAQTLSSAFINRKES